MSARNHREGRRGAGTNQLRRGTNPRRLALGSRQLGRSPRDLATNPRARCTNPHPGKSEAAGQWAARQRRRQIRTAAERLGWEGDGRTVVYRP